MPGDVHRQDQPRDAAVLRRVGIGAHEELADVGDLPERAPDLLAVQHVVVAVALGPRAQRREVGARARLGEALAPHLFAAQDLRQVVGLLRVAALFDQRRARVQRADEVHADVRRTRPGRLFVEDQLLGGRRAAAAELGRPVQARVARVEQPALPVGVPLPAVGPRVARRLRRQRRAARPRATRAASRGNASSASEYRKLHGAGSLRVGRLAGRHRSEPSGRPRARRRRSRPGSPSTTTTTRAAARAGRRPAARGSGPGRTAPSTTTGRSPAPPRSTGRARPPAGRCGARGRRSTSTRWKHCAKQEERDRREPHHVAGAGARRLSASRTAHATAATFAVVVRGRKT